MNSYRTEQADDAPIYGPSPRERLLRDLENYWNTDSKPETLREEVDRLEAGPRAHLANQLRNVHLPDAAERNRVDDALAGLGPREALAKSTADMWRGQR